jgi:hypothetical protein
MVRYKFGSKWQSNKILVSKLMVNKIEPPLKVGEGSKGQSTPILGDIWSPPPPDRLIVFILWISLCIRYKLFDIMHSIRHIDTYLQFCLFLLIIF